MNPPLGANMPTNTQSREPRFPLVYGIQDDLEVSSIGIQSSTGRFFTWEINFLKKNGQPLVTGDVEKVVVVADIGDQDSFPRTNVEFASVVASEVERINTDLINFGQTDLTLLVEHIPEVPEGEVAESVFWNCTCFTSAQLLLHTPDEEEEEEE